MSDHGGASPTWIIETKEGDPFRWRRTADGVLAEWQGLVTVHVDGSGRVSSVPTPGADPLLVSKVLGAGVRAFFRALEGKPSLHGSAVSRDGAALVCLGASGSGKSTAAAMLCERHRCEMLADDVVALEPSETIGGRWCVVPTESFHWLFVEGTRTKRPVPAPGAREGAPVCALVALRFDETVANPQIVKVRGSQVYAALSAAALRFETNDALRRQELDFLALLASSTPVFEFARPSSYDVANTASLLDALMRERGSFAELGAQQ